MSTIYTLASLLKNNIKNILLGLGLLIVDIAVKPLYMI
jgi:hypothetical protein